MSDEGQDTEKEKRKISFNIGNAPEYIWNRSFDIDYWERRIDKINLDRAEDRKEAFYLLLQLTDLYMHIIASELRDPNDVWRMVKEETYTNDIRDVLEYLETEDREMPYNLEMYGKDNKLATVKLEETLDKELNAKQKAAMGLGVPVDLNVEGIPIRMEDSAEAYLRVSNFFLGFWSRVDDANLYKSYKHGFRHPAFNMKTLEYMKEEFPMVVDIDWDAVERDVKEDETEFFMQLEETEEEKEYTIGVFEIQPKVCVELADVVLRLISNLFAEYDNKQVWDDFKQTMVNPDEIPYIYRERFKVSMFLDEDAVPENVRKRAE